MADANSADADANSGSDSEVECDECECMINCTKEGVYILHLLTFKTPIFTHHLIHLNSNNYIKLIKIII